MKINLLILIIFSVINLTISCDYSRDVTSDAKFSRGYEKDQIYRTKIPLLIINGSDPYLAIPGKLHPTIADFQKNPNKFGRVNGVLKENTTIKIKKLTLNKNFESSVVTVSAEILQGTYMGKIVDVGFVSNTVHITQPEVAAIPVPDPDILSLR